jgi:pimeloyl-ACP methyl ester carboxylesterase
MFAAGCNDPRERFGRTWYIDGAGNWGFGVLDVPLGLEDRGYKGQVSNYHWSLTMNPALDQTLRFIARGSGAILGAEISDFLKRNPDAEANIIALSAGTGVAVWAAESMRPGYKLNNLILVGSSISSNYDTRKAISNMKGNIYVYYAASDPVLQGPVRLLGTIDGSFDDAAGLVGLRGAGKASGRIRNIGWSSRYESLGWTGGHADCTNRRFVAGELYKYIVTKPARTGPKPPTAKVADANGENSAAYDKLQSPP